MPINITGVQWENENSLRKYPFDEFSTCIDDAGVEIDPGFITDMSVSSAGSLSNARISSVYSGPGLISIVVSDDSGVVAHFTSTKSTGDEEVVFDSDRPGVVVSARINANSLTHGVSHRFSTPEQSKINPFCIVEFSEEPVVMFVDDTTGSRIENVARLVFSPSVTAVSNKDENGTRLTLTPSKSIMRGISNECIASDLDTACIVPVIQSINGVKPTANGSIAIILE